MAHELAALDLEEKMKWIQDENEETEEFGERWDRLGPYTESNCEMVQIAIKEEGKEKDVPQPSTPVRGRRKRRPTNIAQEEKSENRECSRTRAARKVCSAFGCKNISNYRNYLY